MGREEGKDRGRKGGRDTERKAERKAVFCLQDQQDLALRENVGCPVRAKGSAHSCVGLRGAHRPPGSPVWVTSSRSNSDEFRLPRNERIAPHVEPATEREADSPIRTGVALRPMKRGFGFHVPLPSARGPVAHASLAPERETMLTASRALWGPRNLQGSVEKQHCVFALLSSFQTGHSGDSPCRRRQESVLRP